MRRLVIHLVAIDNCHSKRATESVIALFIVQSGDVLNYVLKRCLVGGRANPVAARSMIMLLSAIKLLLFFH
jgi:hypothetical protein